MKIHFYHKKSILAALIRYFTKSKWNHVSIEIDGNVYEAIGGRLLGSNGVLMGPFKDSYHRKNSGLLIETINYNVGWAKDSAVQSYLKRKVGEKYSHGSALGIAFRWIRGKHKMNICSQLVMQALGRILDYEFKEEYTPGEVYDFVNYLKSQQHAS